MVEFRFDEQTQTLSCRFEGRMDTAVSSTVTERFNAEWGGFRGKADLPRIVFDLEGVDYVASSFLRLCLIAAKGVAKGNFSIVNTRPQVLTVFRIAGLAVLLNVS